MFRIVLSTFLIGHFLGEFYLLKNKKIMNKDIHFKSLIIQNFMYFCVIFLVISTVYGFKLLRISIILSFIYFLMNLINYYISYQNIFNNEKERYLYIVNQSIHLITIIIAAVIVVSRFQYLDYSNFFHKGLKLFGFNAQQTISWTLAIVIIIRPVSEIIKILLSQYQPTTNEEEITGYSGAGAFIGILERLIILIMISQNQYSAIGFVLTSKSIARYTKIVENPQFSEYFLLGTLLSILFVIITYIFIII